MTQAVEMDARNVEREKSEKFLRRRARAEQERDAALQLEREALEAQRRALETQKAQFEAQRLAAQRQQLAAQQQLAERWRLAAQPVAVAGAVLTPGDPAP